VPKYTLLTGATGLVGRYLVRDLLLSGKRLAVVIRASRKENVHERMEAILQKWEADLGHPLPRPITLEGDVCSEGLGLSPADRRWVASHCDRVIHNAAILEFHGADRNGEPWKTNLHGTRHMLELCRQLKLRDLHYVSTAYVCGRREGVVCERELDVGQSFRNHYEESKFLAEQEVRKADFLDQLTVYRPAVIAGDSITGYTSTYHGLYVYMRLIAVMFGSAVPDAQGVRRISLRFNFTGEEGRNIVPVDWVSAVMCRLFDNPAAQGGTYHLAPLTPITSREIVDYSKNYWETNGSRVVDVDFWGHKPINPSMMNEMEKVFYANSTIYESYETTDPRFDTTNLLNLVPDLPCPLIDQTMMDRFLAYGEEDRWGKRRAAKPQVEFWAGDYVRSLVSARESTNGHNGYHAHNGNGNGYHVASGQNGNGKHAGNGKAASNGHDARRIVGLDISGPGGGQWSLHLSGSHAVAVEMGLPTGGQPVLQLPVDDFAALVGGGHALAATRKFRLESPSGSVNGELSESLSRVLFPRVGPIAASA
jgi:nucleoside-diphosphate-sugar epimerase